ncbi:MAG: twin-arginine translocase TatA/TatE family subunit [Halobacteriales archaeon]
MALIPIVPMFIGPLGPVELGVIFLIAVLLFGANKIPELARSTGEAMGEFKKGREEVERELEEIREATEEEVEAAEESVRDDEPSGQSSA